MVLQDENIHHVCEQQGGQPRGQPDKTPQRKRRTPDSASRSLCCVLQSTERPCDLFELAARVVVDLFIATHHFLCAPKPRFIMAASDCYLVFAWGTQMSRVQQPTTNESTCIDNYAPPAPPPKSHLSSHAHPPAAAVRRPSSLTYHALAICSQRRACPRAKEQQLTASLRRCHSSKL